MISVLRRVLPVVIVLPVIVGVAVSQLASPADASPARAYVVRTRTTSDAVAAALAVDAHPYVTYGTALAGFAALLTGDQVGRLRADARVRDVEADSRTGPVDRRPRTPVAGVDAPNWGLGRIDGADPPFDGSRRPASTGTGVTIWVLDTGVDTTHPDFGGRARQVDDAVDGTSGEDAGGSSGGSVASGSASGSASARGRGTGDCDGHGTVVAGIAASTEHGVAPGALIRSVKVLDCDGAGRLSNLLAGVDYVAAHATGPSVAVMSWSYGPSAALVLAVGQLLARGVFVAASAGNTGGDDCGVAPRSVPGVLVVANSTITDQRASTSSTGACVGLYAPGTGIVGPVPGGGYASYSGTSMAAPHVAGVAALYEQATGVTDPATVTAWILGHATPGVIAGGATDGTPDRLLDTAGL